MCPPGATSTRRAAPCFAAPRWPASDSQCCRPSWWLTMSPRAALRSFSNGNAERRLESTPSLRTGGRCRLEFEPFSTSSARISVDLRRRRSLLGETLSLSFLACFRGRRLDVRRDQLVVDEFHLRQALGVQHASELFHLARLGVSPIGVSVPEDEAVHEARRVVPLLQNLVAQRSGLVFAHVADELANGRKRLLQRFRSHLVARELSDHPSAFGLRHVSSLLRSFAVRLT